MQCPRCGNKWDVSKSPCSHCGLRVHLPGPLRSVARTSVPLTSSLKSIPPRPQVSPMAVQTRSQLLPASYRLQSPLRAMRLVTDSLPQRGDSYMRGVQGLPGPALLPASSSLIPRTSNHVLPYESRQLMPGTLLRSGRYRLHELRSQQEWLSGAYEAVWVAQDAQRSGILVTICELAIPGQDTMRAQSLLRTSTMALTSIGRHPRVPTLWDAFGDQGRSFFVFEPVDGESLLMHVRRTGRALPEQDVVECCLQVTEVLDLLTQQTPPLVHGLIRPERIFVSHDGTRYTLANFSALLAGGGTRFIAGIERSHLSPYTAPELVHGAIDIRADLYSLLATAYHIVTGSLPVATGEGIPQARRLNPMVSSQFEAILMKGLNTSISQCYQHPGELYADLLLLQSSFAAVLRRNSSLLSERRSEPPGHLQQAQLSQTSHAAISQMLPDMLSSDLAHEASERKSLRPEEVSPPGGQNDLRKSLLWIAGVVLCLLVVLLLSRGFM